MSLILALIGPSGSGKTHLGLMLQKFGYKEIISYTTRKPRDGEIQDVSYHFVNEEEFVAIEKVEEIEYSGAHYCTARKDIIDSQPYRYIVVTLDGMNAIKSNCPDIEIFSIFLSCTKEKCIERMKLRGDSHSNIQSRIANYDISKEFENIDKCDFIFDNNADDITEEIKRLLNTIQTKSKI